MVREDGGRVRRGDHLPSHRYIRNTSTRGTSPTEHPLNAGRKRQTSQKARNSPRTWVGQKKKEITETKEWGRDLHQWEGAVKEERCPHNRKPLRGRRLRVAEGGSFGAMEESAAAGCGGQSREIPAWRISADQHSPAREACLITCRGGRGWELRLGLWWIAGRGLGLAV